MGVEAFIDRWERSGAAERANYQLFLSELCDLIGVPHPDPATPDTEQNAYVFERAVTFHHGDGTTSPGRIDLYKRGCFVLEAKQGVDADTPNPPPRTGHGRRGSKTWDVTMIRAREEAAGRVRYLRPAFQAPEAVQTAMPAAIDAVEPDSEIGPAARKSWPKALPAQMRLLRETLERTRAPMDAATLAAGFGGARQDRLAELLETLADLGQVKPMEDGRYATIAVPNR